MTMNVKDPLQVLWYDSGARRQSLPNDFLLNNWGQTPGVSVHHPEPIQESKTSINLNLLPKIPQELAYLKIFDKGNADKKISDDYLRRINKIGYDKLFMEDSEIYAYIQTAYYYHIKK